MELRKVREDEVLFTLTGDYVMNFNMPLTRY
jgi:hypothetical protein